MNPVALGWLVVFAVAALIFFGTAVIVVVLGFRDLKDLLTSSRKRERTET